MVIFNGMNDRYVAISPRNVIMVEESTADNSRILLSTSDGYISVYVKESVYTVTHALNEAK